MGGREDRRDEQRRAKKRAQERDYGYTYVMTGSGKNRERKKVFNKQKFNLSAGAKGKTKGFDYKGKGAKKFVAGANVIDQATGKVAKRKGFSDFLKATGNRADDPRNWEFHYKAPGQKYSTQGKNDRQVDNVAVARRRAESKARKTGRQVFEVQQIEYQTAGIVADTEASGAKAKAMGGGFGSTQVAGNVAAQKRRGQRGRGGGVAQRGAFDAQTQTRSSRIA
jgi:hypothetical protein